VPQVMAQFVLKIELLSHIMGTTPILEMARAYGLRPRLWLLLSNVFSTVVLIENTVNKQTNIANRTQLIKNPNWWKADQLVI